MYVPTRTHTFSHTEARAHARRARTRFTNVCVRVGIVRSRVVSTGFCAILKIVRQRFNN